MAMKQHDARKSIARMAFAAGWMKRTGVAGLSVNESIRMDIEFGNWWKEHNVSTAD